MCDGVSEVAEIAGAVAAVAGSAVSYTQGQAAAAAANAAQQQQQASQAAAFSSRMSAAQQQLQDQTAINEKADSTFTANQAAEQANQVQALQDRETALSGVNDQEQAIATQANQVVNQATAQTSAPALQAAQSQQEAQQDAMNAPVAQDAASTSPLASTASSSVTKDAVDARLAAASKSVDQYGSSLARLSSYSAPITLANSTAQDLGTNLMPAEVADRLVKSGASAILAPSTTAYQNAGQYGQAVNEANQLTTQGALGIAATRDGNAVDLANLTQADDSARIQSNLNLTQQRAATLAALGSGLTSIGNAGIQYGAATGGLQSLLGTATPSSAAIQAAPASSTTVQGYKAIG